MASQAIRRTQYTQLEAIPAGPAVVPGAAAVPPGTRRIQVYPRSNVPVEITSSHDPASGQSVTVVNAGVNVIVEGVSVEGARRSARSTSRPTGW